MNTLKVGITVALLMFSFHFNAQKKIEPTPENIALAKKLKATYENDDVALKKSKDIISFDLDKKNDKVTVRHKKYEELLNISPRADILKFEFYDGQSEIDLFEFKYRNNKEAYFRVSDDSYTSNDLFHNDARVKSAAVDFPLLGYSYYYESVKNIKDIKYFTSIYFNDLYPIVNKEIKVQIPDWLTVEIKEMNFDGYSIKKSEKYDAKKKVKIITYKVDDLSARFDEKRSPGPSYIYPHLLFLSKSYTDDGEEHKLFNETKDLYKWYKSLVDSMEEDTSFLEEKVAELTENAANDDEKIKNIYYWIQDNIRYIAFEDGIAGFKPDESQNVFKKRYGDCKGMANLTKQMLKIAGFDARLTWIGTKRIAYDYSLPTLSVDNHMICTLYKDGKPIFLDGTEKYNSFGEYAERIQGKQVLIEDGDDFILEKVPVVKAEHNNSKFSFYAAIQDDALVGKAQKKFNGESRASFLYYYNNLETDKKKEAIQFYLNGDDRNLKVANIVTSNLEDRDLEITMDYDLSIANAVSSFDDEIYIELDYNKEFGKFEFEERETDYEFRYKNDTHSHIELKVPDGYKINELPKSIDIDTNNYTINVAFEQKENTLIYKKRFTIKNAVITKGDFEQWNEIIKQLKGIYAEQIILSKTN